MPNINPFNYPSVNNDILSLSNLVIKGALIRTEHIFSIPGSSSYYFDFLTSNNLPFIYLAGLNIDTDSITISLTTGGVATGGLPLPFYNYNLNSNLDNAGIVEGSFKANPSISSSGSTAFSMSILSERNTSIDDGSIVPIILKPNTQYQIDIRNNSGGGSKTIDLDILFGNLH